LAVSGERFIRCVQSQSLDLRHGSDRREAAAGRHTPKLERHSMSKLIELRAKRVQTIADAQKIVLQETVTTEDRAKFDAMMEDVTIYEGDIQRIERIDQLEAESRQTQRPPRPNPDGSANGVDPVHTAAVSRAFEKYIRRGYSRMTEEERSILERRDVTVAGGLPASPGTGPSGATMIPQQFLTTMIDAQKLIGNIVSIVGKKVTDNNGAPIKVALSNDTGNTLTTLTAETSVITEQDPAFSGFVMQTDTVATMVKVSRQELDDSYFNLEAWLRDKFALRYYRGLEYLITNGNGSNVAALPAGATLGATAAAHTGPVYQDFVNAYASQDPAYIPNSTWVMSSVTRAFIMGQVDLYGRPLFIPSPNSGMLDQILGRPIVLNQALPSAVNPSSTVTAIGVLFGDFAAGYLLRTDGGISILRLDERFADQLEVGFIGYARLGGAPTDAGTHPLRTLVTPHS
jgi:HK97 family phage major capsid protein